MGAVFQSDAAAELVRHGIFVWQRVVDFLPSGKRLHNYEKSPRFTGKINFFHGHVQVRKLLDQHGTPRPSGKTHCK